jgi:hypothetical protein
LDTQGKRLLAFIYLQVSNHVDGKVFGPKELEGCPDYKASGFRALKRDLRGKTEHYVVKVAFQRYKLTAEGAAEAQRLLEF